MVGPVCRAMTALLLSVSLLSLLLLPAFGARSSLQSEQRLVDSAAAHLPPPPTNAEMGSLVHVQLLHRHGDRAPVHVSPVDRPVWTERVGLRGGQLSRIGMAQLHAMGKFMRKNYVHESDNTHNKRRIALPDAPSCTAAAVAQPNAAVTFVPFISTL